MKRFKYLFLVLVLSFFITGCGSTSKNVDVTTVKSKMEDYNLTVTDTTDKYGYATQAYYGYKDDIKINFVKGEKRYDIQGIFLDECKNVYSVCGNDYKKSDDGGDNWTTLTVTNTTTYYFVGWVGDSYITITAPLSQQSKMENLIEDLGF